MPWIGCCVMTVMACLNIAHHAVHGSDAADTAAVEIKFFFPEIS